MIYAQCIFKEHFSANIVKDISLVKTGGLMYLVRTKQGDKFVESADDVKHINKNDVLEVFMLENWIMIQLRLHQRYETASTII